MSISNCPNCQMRVIANVDGECPSCRTIISVPADQLGPVPWDFRLAEIRERESLPLVEAKESAKDDKPTHFDVFWVLFSFRGRIPRSIFWLASIAGPVALYLIFVVAKGLLVEPSPLLGLIALTVLCAMIWMSFAVGVKRLHDLNWTGWLILIALIPALGPMFMLFTAGMMKGTHGRNDYGTDPLEVLE